MADLPSILGGMAQGFIDFGKGAVDLFGTGGAAIGDLVESARTGKVTTKNQDDFRKWLYNTDSTKDAAAKGLGTTLNGVQTALDYIPGVNVLTRNPLGNAAQGALGGLADEFKTYGENYDLGRAGQRAAVSGAAAAASGSLADALKGSSNALLSSNTLQGLARGATGGAITGGGYAAIDGGDVLEAAKQGAGVGALIGGATGAIQDFKPAKTYDMALTDEEKAARIANAKNMLANEQNPERIAELNNQIKDLGGALADADMAVNNPRLTPEQEAYFKDSVIRDENGNLIPLYHGSNSKFTVFDSSKGGQSNKTAKVGHWFTPSEEGARNFANSVWYGDESEPTVYSTYLNVKNPKIYEAVDNSAQIKALNNEMDGLQRQLDGMRRGSDDFNATYKKYNDLAKQIDNLSYGDPYEQFRSDIYAMEGKTPYQANVGGLGMMMDDENAATQKYVQSLRDQGYDGIIIRGTNYDNGTLGGINDQYVVFDSNQIKDINNLKPTDAPSIMESRIAPEELDLARALSDQDLLVNNAKIAPGQLGLFDDMPTQTPKTGTRQTSLFDQPDNPYLDYYSGDIDTMPLTPEAPANPYAPVDGKLTQAMKDRYWELMSDANQFKYTGTDNDLYNKINPETLPKGYKELQHLLDTQDTQENMVEGVLKNKVGTDNVWQADTDKLLDYVWGGDNHEKKMYYKTLEDEIARAKKNAVALGLDNYNAEEELTKAKRQDLQLKAYKKAELEALDKVIQVSDTDDIMHALSNYNRRGIRTGDAGALDTVLSERLGIAPGNTIKITKNVGGDLSKSAAGRYARNARDIAVSDINSPEGKVSTMAHERLHSFQNESRPESAGRYDPEVVEAYKQLQKDLGHYYKSNSEIKKRYKRDVDYWASSGEQESRMFQQYLENKGYTDNSAWRKMGGKADEWGNEINPAFDKFIDKLRDLSKRGVALPALAALFGGGAYMASQNNDKEKEVK